MQREDFEKLYTEPLNEIERYAILVDRALNHMQLCKETHDVAMYKFWKKQYWIASHAHSILLKQFYLGGN